MCDTALAVAPALVLRDERDEAHGVGVVARVEFRVVLLLLLLLLLLLFSLSLSPNFLAWPALNEKREQTPIYVLYILLSWSPLASRSRQGWMRALVFLGWMAGGLAKAMLNMVFVFTCLACERGIWNYVGRCAHEQAWRKAIGERERYDVSLWPWQPDDHLLQVWPIA